MCVCVCVCRMDKSLSSTNTVKYDGLEKIGSWKSLYQCVLTLNMQGRDSVNVVGIPLYCSLLLRAFILTLLALLRAFLLYPCMFSVLLFASLGLHSHLIGAAQGFPALSLRVHCLNICSSQFSACISHLVTVHCSVFCSVRGGCCL